MVCHLLLLLNDVLTGIVELAREEMAAKISKRSLPTRALHKEAERVMGSQMERIWDRVKA